MKLFYKYIIIIATAGLSLAQTAHNPDPVYSRKQPPESAAELPANVQWSTVGLLLR